MALNMDDAEAERLERLRGAATGGRRLDEIRRIAARASARPVLDRRSEDEILGYDERGLPGE